MSFITVEAQPAGEIPHGRHCQGGKPGWKSCKRCAAREVKTCVTWWEEVMGGVPEIVRIHTEARMAEYEPRKGWTSPIAFIDFS